MWLVRRSPHIRLAGPQKNIFKGHKAFQWDHLLAGNYASVQRGQMRITIGAELLENGFPPWLPYNHGVIFRLTWLREQSSDLFLPCGFVFSATSLSPSDEPWLTRWLYLELIRTGTQSPTCSGRGGAIRGASASRTTAWPKRSAESKTNESFTMCRIRNVPFVCKPM